MRMGELFFMLLKTFGHIGKDEPRDAEKGDRPAEILDVDLVERVRVSVMPVEVMFADGTQAQSGDPLARQRADVGAPAATADRRGFDGAEQSTDRQLDLVDGVRIHHDGGWALVLPDPEDPTTTVVAEGPDRAAAARLADEYVRRIEQLIRP